MWLIEIWYSLQPRRISRIGIKISTATCHPEMKWAFREGLAKILLPWSCLFILWLLDSAGRGSPYRSVCLLWKIGSDAVNVSTAYSHCEEQKCISNMQSDWREGEFATAELFFFFFEDCIDLDNGKWLLDFRMAWYWQVAGQFILQSIRELGLGFGVGFFFLLAFTKSF